MQDDNHLPDSLLIELVRADRDNDHSEGSTFLARSLAFPGLTGGSDEAEQAVANLLWSILNTQDLAPEVVEALTAAGHTEEVVNAWRGLAQGRLNRRYRYDADAAASILNEYTDAGVPALTACRYLDLAIIEPAVALEAHANGGTPDDALSYIDHSATHKWWNWDYDIDPWIRSGFPFARGVLYAMDCSVEVAYDWERLAAEYTVSDSDLSTLVRRGCTPAAARAHLETDDNNAATLIASVRDPGPGRPAKVLGGQAGVGEHDPWTPTTSPAGADPWRDNGEDEPPF